MGDNRIWVGFLSPGQIQDAMRRDDSPRAPLSARLMARLFASPSAVHSLCMRRG